MQTLVALHPTERLSPWRQVWKNIHFRVWIPGLAWSVLHPGGPPAPSWFPLVPSDLGIWTSPPWRLSWTPVQGGYPQYHSILSSPKEGFTPSPLTPRFKCFLTTKIFAYLLSSAVFFYSVNCKELHWMQKLLLIEEFITLELIKNILTCLIIIVIWLKYKTVVNYGTLRY